ncbi:hypothetical protein PAECIP111891_05859 [Paenibacillus allorhizoplanae]|uniref:Glycoside hydrolase n=1 Tax=Paenibacillus allorhizoplanae TaxID=2905648 RepID=A0ABM9CW42_9BACL|nr:hypothetical protein [Paenibacillus allorhizoplanae]CAH1225751.1 hypothetical protein PAECIP111891_05859 [Paenibacillus allorhizoplanae]
MRNRLSFLSLWSINDALNLEQLKAGLDELRLAGLEGVIFHPRFYPNEPVYMSEEYLHILSNLILYAKSTGMIFWIYDENGWPSGTASGEVIKRLPDSSCKYVNWISDEEGGRLVFGEKAAVSSLDAAATQTFIAIIHEGYRKGLLPEAFEYVTGFFSDEVAFLDGHGITVKTGAIPWDEGFVELYEGKYHEALLPNLPLLFTTGKGYETFRARYWEMLTDAIIASFYKPIADWCEKHGKKFTAHLKAEESPFFQLSYSGSCFQVLKYVETPAIDALERFPGNNFYPRIAHSIAMQQGRDGALVEAMGGSGWGVSPESFTNYVMWLAGHGVEHIVLHLNQLKLTTQAVQDWPPSMPSHLTWKDAFPALLASIKKQAAQLPDLRANPEVLIVTPTRGIMAHFDTTDAMQMNEHDGSNIPASTAGILNAKMLALVEACHAAGLHYELSEERFIEESGLFMDGALRIGMRDYSHVLIADGCRWKDPAIEDRLRSAGITLCHSEDWRDVLPIKASAVVSAAVTSDLKQTPWMAESPQWNQILVELQQQKSGKLLVELNLEESESFGGMTLLLLDAVSEVWVNGQPMELLPTTSGFEGDISVAQIAGKSKLMLEVKSLPEGEAFPIAFLRGNFAVKSKAALIEKDEHQWMLEGPLELSPISAVINSANLIESGFPYASSPIAVRKTVFLDASERGDIQLTDLWADAAFVKLGGQELGWCWGPDWSVPLPQSLLEGSYELEVLLYPSTFNMYGPHHHLDGDRYLTSPDQYKGIKNFADRPDAPEQTRVSCAHFVKWGISGDVQLLHWK